MNKAIILAAGEGTRMKSQKSKVLHTLLNKPMIHYVIDACEQIEIKNPIIIGGNNYEILHREYGEKIILKKQEIGSHVPYGTGYAVSLALDEISDADQVLILTGDIPLIQSKTLKKCFAYHEEQESVATVLTAEAEDPTGYGRIVKTLNGDLLKIVEHKDCDDEQLAIKEFNSGIMILNGRVLKSSIKKLSTDNSQGELYLTDIFEILHEEDEVIKTYLIDDVTEVYGINSKDQLEIAENILRNRVNREYMKNGVVMENASNIFIEPGVEIGEDTIIRSGAKIVGKTKIGRDCVITGDTTILDSEIGDEVLIKSSMIEHSVVLDGVDIGPYSHLRPNSHLGEKVHIGNFVEVKNATLGSGTKAGHLAYIGDADLGKDINIGCGAIFVNYDGKNKHRTTVEDGAFIGSNSNIVAPINIYKEGYIAAGSTVTKDVPEGNLTIERAKQVNIPNWVEKKRKRDEK